jgi:cell division protein FtsB
MLHSKISRQYLFNIIFSLLFVYFAFHSVFGNRGINSYLQLNAQSIKSYSELSDLRAQRLEIEHTANLLKSEDKDILEQYAKEVLGMALPNEKMFTVKSKMEE